MLFSPVFAVIHPRRSSRPSRVPYTLPSSVSRKSCICHSCENCRGVYQQFPLRNVPIEAPLQFRSGDPDPIVTFNQSRSLHLGWTFETFRLANVPTCFRAILFPFTFLRTLLHSRKTQLFYFQAIPHSLQKTTGGGGRGAIANGRRYSQGS